MLMVAIGHATCTCASSNAMQQTECAPAEQEAVLVDVDLLFLLSCCGQRGLHRLADHKPDPDDIGLSQWLDA